jgi:hypothetical protein
MSGIEPSKNIPNTIDQKKSPELTTSPEIKQGEVIFESIREKSSANPELKKVLDLIKWEIIPILEWSKWTDVQDFLSNPEIFTSNPAQYKNLFLVTEVKLSPEQVNQLKWISPKIWAYYNAYIRTKEGSYAQLQKQNTITAETRAVTAETRAVTAETRAVTAETRAVTAETRAVTAETRAVTAETIADENLKKQQGAVAWIISILPEKWNKQLDGYVAQNITNDEVFEKAKALKPDLKFTNDEDKKLYLKTIFFIDNQDKIKNDLNQTASEGKSWVEQNKAQENVKIFQEHIGTLNSLNFPQSVKNIGDTLTEKFPPTRATETARIQAEKLEKSHTIYRDGTSLYFVNKDNPKDIKKIEIFADRATLTVNQGGLSLTTDLPLVTREEKEQKERVRWLEKDYQKTESSSNILIGHFLQSRGTEYTQIQWLDKNGIDIINSRPIHPKQEEYNDREKLLATQSRAELEKSWKSQKDIIDTMIRLSEEIRDDNQQYFTLGQFGEEKGVKEADEVKSMLEKRILWLKLLRQSTESSDTQLRTLETEKKKVSIDDPRFQTDTWEKSAKEYIADVSQNDIGIDGLSDESFQLLLRRLIERTPGKWVWANGPELWTDTTKRSAQLDELRKLWSVVGNRIWWQSVERQIRMDGTLANEAFMGKNWKFVAWVQSLEKKPTETPK